LYVARVRNGFVPRIREEVFKRLSSGKVGGMMQGLPAILITTTGRRPGGN
jgi:hypothetical protein